MLVNYETTIEPDDTILFFDISICAHITPGEPDSFDTPGYDPEAELSSVKVIGFGTNGRRVDRSSENEDIFRIFDDVAFAFVEQNWPDFEEGVFESARNELEAYICDRD